MPSYKAPVKDTLFLLKDVLDMASYGTLNGFDEMTPDTLEAILSEGAKLSEEVFAPLNRSGDVAGCTRHADGSVSPPQGFASAYEAYVAGGWLGLSADPAYGGQGLPYTLAAILNEFMSSANMALAMYPGLTQGAVAAIQTHANDALKSLYLPPMIAGRWTGTMNLTEPHCGTDLGLLKTKAIPQPDGSYRLTGTKIFISAGEHDMVENIIHLVLARVEGAPDGVKGISLFLVPKRVVTAEGRVGAANGVSCGALEHKMGIHGNATCVMNFDDAQGWLMGELNRGLNAMFVMMNEARLGVAIQGLAQSQLAYENALAYARERLQGRALTGAKEPQKPADPILVHADVRKNLLTIRAFNEAARALVLWTALMSDVAHRTKDKAVWQEADDHLGLLTPVLKGVLTDLGFENTVLAQQVFGGHGYIEEWGMSQCVRDARIAMIYEGANGIQAMDLVGRKLPRDGGRALMRFFAQVEAFIKANPDAQMQPFVAPLAAALADHQQASLWFMQNAMSNPDHAGAGAGDYMHLFGLVALGFMWAKIAKAALEKQAEHHEDEGFYGAKLIVGRHFMERLLPQTATHLARIRAGSTTMMTLPADLF